MKNTKIYSALLAGVLLFSVSCKKGAFNVNTPNPNQPSSIDPKFVLAAALVNTAGDTWGGNEDFMNYYMGYWSVSGDYIPAAGTVQYKINTDFFTGNWDGVYPILKNLQSIIDAYSSNTSGGSNYIAVAKIMKAYLYQRLVDIYNNIPYTQALNGGTNNFPAYDDAKTVVYPGLVSDLEDAIAKINAAPLSADQLTSDGDVMFAGNMQKWIRFANTLKLKILMRLTNSGASYITTHLAGLSGSSFLGAGEDALVNPGYTNDLNGRQNPLWGDIGSTTSGTAYTDNAYYRACTYGVNFYKNNNDPRVGLFYAPNSSGLYKGRNFGSTALEHNSDISAIGGPSKGLSAATTGVLKSPLMGTPLITASESFFLQAEAIQRGYMSGTAATAFQNGVAESFRFVGVASAAAAAATYTSQLGLGNNVNFTTSTNPIQTIILQKWASNNTIDPLESWSDWRRLGIPTDLPSSIYPGALGHPPYRLLYPTSEYNYNGANVNAQGTIDFNTIQTTSKIFWMP